MTNSLIQQSREFLKFGGQAFDEVWFVFEPMLIEIQSQSENKDGLYFFANIVLAFGDFNHLIGQFAATNNQHIIFDIVVFQIILVKLSVLDGYEPSESKLLERLKIQLILHVEDFVVDPDDFVICIGNRILRSMQEIVIECCMMGGFHYIAIL